MTYLVFHDGCDGAMDVFPGACCLAHAQAEAGLRNEKLDRSGNEEAGHWAGYETLPTEVPVYKTHPQGAMLLRHCGRQ